MTIFKTASAALCIAACTVGMAQDAAIEGSAPFWSGREVRLFSYQDPITRSSVEWNASTVAPDGTFELRLPAKAFEAAGSDALCVYLAVNRYQSPLCIGRGEKVTIQVLSDERYRLIDTWLNGEVVYQISNPDTNSVAWRIGAFDDAYFDFYGQNTALVNSTAIRPAIRRFEETWLPDTSAHSFYADYVRYSIAEMKLSTSHSKKQLYEAHLQGSPLRLDNPAWFNFFDNFYASYFDAYSNRFGGEAIFNRLHVAGIDGLGLDTLLRKDEFLMRSDIRHLVTLKSINEVRRDKRYPKASLRKICSYIAGESTREDIKSIARALEQKLDPEMGKISLTALPLMPAEKVRELVLKGPKPILLALTATWSTESTKEMSMLHQLAEKYQDEFKVLEVRIDADGIASAPPPWLVATPADTRAFIEMMEAHTVPSFWWFESDGTLSNQQIQKPGEGLEKMLFRLSKERQEREKIKVGQ